MCAGVTEGSIYTYGSVRNHEFSASAGCGSRRKKNLPSLKGKDIIPSLKREYLRPFALAARASSRFASTVGSIFLNCMRCVMLFICCEAVPRVWLGISRYLKSRNLMLD